MGLDAIIALKQRMLFLERAHASAKMGHFVLDPFRRTIEFSSWVRENIGFNDMPIPLDRLPEIIPEDERETFRKTVEDIVEGQRDFAFETNVITAKGTIRTQRVSGIPAFENQHRREGLIGYFGILQEITGEKEAERSLLEARDSAQAQLAARANMLAAVSHEIRTPLSGILGIIDQLKRERSVVERERAIALIEDSCEVLLDTLDAILHQSRIDHEIDNHGSKRFSPSGLAYRVAELFRPLARRKGLVIEVNATSTAEAIGNPARIQQVVANFVSNAVKFTQSGAVTIFVQEPGKAQSDWTFVVSDTGSGMDEKRVDRIFDPFGETSDDTFGKSVGTGLGLSITRDLVQAMGGRIEVESEMGRGSSFTVRLPLNEPLEAEPESQKAGSMGYAMLAIERASDRVLAEAAAVGAGYAMVDRDQIETKPDGSVVLILDAALLEDLDEIALSKAHRIIAIGEAHTSPDPAGGIAIEYVSHAGVSRSLAELLGGD